MAASRTSQFNKLHKVLKKHYQAVAPDPTRSVFEQLLFASCLENAHYDRAEEALAALEHSLFDWNEVRVTTIRELSEVFAVLPDPPAAGNRVKRVLQSIFESTYSFDLEDLRKQNLGPAVERLKKIDGTTPFSVAYVTQAALGGHAIPVDAGALGALSVVGLVTEEDVQAGVVPGLERAIAKSKGIEFGSQLHQLGADFVADPYARQVHEILLEVNPDARGQLPKKRTRKRAGSRSKPEEPKAGDAARDAAQSAESIPEPLAAGSEPKTADQPSAVPEKETAAKEKEDAAKEEREVKEGTVKDVAAKESQQAPGAKKKSAEAKKKSTPRKKAGTDKANPAADAGAKRSPSAGLAKKKPR
jgi:hypothetical protein